MKRYQSQFVLLVACALSTACATRSFQGGSTAQLSPDADTETTSIQTRIARGDQLAGQTDWVRARPEYRIAAELMRANGELPDLPLRRIANSFFYERDFRSAAEVLAELASQAGPAGKFDVEASALVDAAWLYHQVGAPDRVRQSVQRLQQLLQSPCLSDSTRATLTRRLYGK